MTPADLISQLEGAHPSEARAILASNGVPPGTGEAFFRRVADLYGTDPMRSSRLAAHWKLLLQQGDAPHYVLRAKAIGERCQGKWAASAQTFIEAGRQAPTREESLAFQRGAVDSLGRAGRVAEAVELGARLVRGLSRLGETEQAARVRLNVGNALLWADDYVAARKWLRPAAQALSDPRERAAALLGLAGAELYGGDPTATKTHAEEARRLFIESEDPHFADLCSLTLAQEALLRGRADEALATLLSIRERMAESSPVDHARVQEFVGDAQLVLNLWQEAEDSYREALTITALPLNIANCHYGVGLALAAQGESGAAKRALRRAMAGYEALGNAAWAGAAATALAEALLAEGRAKEAADAAREAVARLVEARSPYHLTCARLALASAEYDETLLRQSESLIRRHGYRALAWKTHAIRASHAEGKGKLRHFRKMLTAILDGRLLADSNVSRLAFLRDKADALADYLALLLSKGGAGIEEALRVIAQSRSVALIDEILSSTAGKPSEEAARRLAELREELNRVASAHLPGGGARLSPIPTSRLTALQRRWIEMTVSLQPVRRAAEITSLNQDCAVLVETGSEFYAIRSNAVTRLPISHGELDELLKWLDFELLAPMVWKEAPSAEAMSLLAELRARLVDPWLAESSAALPLCPDGRLWRVPWQALLATGDAHAEAIMLASPLFTGGAGAIALPARPKAAVWYFDAPDLPSAHNEVEAFLGTFRDAKVIVNARDAMETGAVDILHVVSHARSQPTNPMFSSIQLADGWLPAAEIARCAIRPRLVTLSACDTGRVTTWSRTEPDGLARAFLARGASAVLASAWPLDDVSASAMMGRYYQALSAGDTVVAALRDARSVARAQRAHPYFWAQFVLFGGYRHD